MSPSPDATEAAPLSDDMATLKALLLAGRATATKLAGQNEHLRAIIKELQRALFGRPSEKAAHPDQFQLALEDIEQALAQREAEEERADAMLKASRNPAASWQPGRSPEAPAARRDRDRARRPDLATRPIPAVAAAAPPLSFGLCTNGCSSISNARPTCSWMVRGPTRRSRGVSPKDRAPVLDPGRKRTKSGYPWAIGRDDRPWAGPDSPAVAYLYAPGRGAEHAIRPLGGFAGVLQVDGYAAYQALVEPAALAVASDPGLLLVPRPAPVLRDRPRRRRPDRRGRVAADQRPLACRDDDPWPCARAAASRPPRAKQAPRRQPADLARRPARQSSRGRVRIAEAIRYALKLWSGLRLFLDDGSIEIDTNVVERAICPIALNRKNALFAGSGQSGIHWGVIASLIETCKLNAVNPQAYLADVLSRLVNRHPASQAAPHTGRSRPRPWQRTPERWIG
jgi:transposase